MVTRAATDNLVIDRGEGLLAANVSQWSARSSASRGHFGNRALFVHGLIVRHIARLKWDDFGSADGFLEPDGLLIRRSRVEVHLRLACQDLAMAVRAEDQLVTSRVTYRFVLSKATRARDRIRRLLALVAALEWEVDNFVEL